ncbi:MAG: hypothetical protein HYR73_09420 [Candidatus Eisenbacteria bacterium]|nr:hypothetical protein [Candidatus Eisenbacteria bacterium]
MNAFEQVAVAWQALLRSAAKLRRAGMWIPLLVFGATQFLVLASLWSFAHPLVSWFMVPLLHRIGGDGLLRYPNVFRVMPALFGQADLALGATVGAISVGALTIRFAAGARGTPIGAGSALGLAARRALPLVLANLPFNVLVFALSFGLDWWLASRGSGGAVRKFSGLVVLSGSIVLQSVFFFVTCEVVLAGHGVLGALAAVPRAAARGFWAAMFLGVLLVLPLLPIQMLSGRSSMLIDRGSPELVGWMLVAQIVIELVIWFLLAGGATLIYLTLIEERAGAER